MRYEDWKIAYYRECLDGYNAHIKMCAVIKEQNPGGGMQVMSFEQHCKYLYKSSPFYLSDEPDNKKDDEDPDNSGENLAGGEKVII